MGKIENFFIELGFNFEEKLKLKKLNIEDNPELCSKIENAVYFYHTPNQTNTSFYLINEALDILDLKVVRKYIWNENKADLLFYYKKENVEKLILQYAKASPKISDIGCELDTFSITEKDQKKIEKIRCWKFDSGLFWNNYQEFLSKSKKYNSIDKELVGTLQALKNSLNNTFASNINIKEKEKYIQALIDRTLYIKYLEDNHVINSYFYEYHFGRSNIDYKKLLSVADSLELNKLFGIIHNIFNNELFEKPEIPEKYLTSEVCNLIFNSLNHNVEKGQLHLFDFRFDIIPVEFISYIYEIFLTDKQKENGIYYTPKKLAQLIVDDVIPENRIGSVLDPSCGSGMFLIIAFQKLLENSNEHLLKGIDKRIEYRTKLIKENIFGIEKELTAQRFSLFSLSLQLFRGLDKTEIRNFITKKLQKNGKVELFKKHSFFANIVEGNSLEIIDNKVPHKDKVFDYIVGNPPFFEIKDTNEFKTEIEFLNNHEAEGVTVNKLVGKHQISQCFFLRIKDWSSHKTRFGFVSNSSNFYNDKSSKFQSFFYSKYNIEKVYELSRVKEILFENAKESVVTLVFTNQLKNKNIFQYFPVKKGLFSEKPFELLIIEEDNYIAIDQSKLIAKSIKLRDFLTGNEFDRGLIEILINNNGSLYSFLKKINKTKDVVNNGLQIVGKEQLINEFDISEEKYKTLSKDERRYFSDKFKAKYTRKEQDKLYPTPIVYPRNLKPYKIEYLDTFVGEISNFQRTRIPEIYAIPKILINRVGSKLKAAFIKEKIYYNFDIYSIFPEKNDLGYLFTAIINSQLINYFNDFVHRKRLGSSFTKIGYDAIKEIPIPKDLDSDLVDEISKISQDLSNGSYEYSEIISDKLNDLIFNLYELSYLEKQKIKDYFLTSKRVTKSKNEIGKYKEALKSSIDIFLKNQVVFDEEYNKGLGLVVIKIKLNNSPKPPNTKQVGLYILNEIFEQNPQENFLASREKIWGEDCVYIIKQDINTNWTETKAYEDGQEILKRLIKHEE